MSSLAMMHKPRRIGRFGIVGHPTKSLGCNGEEYTETYSGLAVR